MPLTLTADRQHAIDRAKAKLAATVTDAMEAEDIETLRQRLNHVWFANHGLYELVKDAEAATRREALAQLEKVA